MLDCFRPQQGLPIMNCNLSSFGEALADGKEFPSPTGATYYESLEQVKIERENIDEFPSPTGATYYESLPTKP